MKTLYVKDLQAGITLIGETFVIAEVKQAVDKNGNPYYDMALADKTGQVKAKIWGDAFPNVERSAIKAGTVVAVDASVGLFKNEAQLTILKLMSVDEVKLEDYLESSMFPADEMWAELQDIATKQITNPHLVKMFENLFADEVVSRKLKYWPAGISYHHDFRSGLLQHILECLGLAHGMEKFFPDLDFDIVRAGIIMHDIGKLTEMDASGLVPRYTLEGTILGHIYLGTTYVDKYFPVEGPENLKNHLKHIVLSHHGEKEKGSPVLPATAEAMLVSQIDDTSAKARMADAGVKSPADEYGLTGYNRFLQRWMWSSNPKVEPGE